MAKTADKKKTKTSNNGFDNHAHEKDELLSVLRIMLIARQIDTKAMNLLRQGKTFFHIAAAGHEAIQVAVGRALDPSKDWLFPYYRDLAIVLTAGLTTQGIFSTMLCKE